MKNSLNQTIVTVFISILVLLYFGSCAPQENFVTFYLKNEMNKEFLLVNTSATNEEVNIQNHATLNLNDSESWDDYLESLYHVNIRSFEIQFEHSTGNISNGSMYIEDVYLGSFTEDMSFIQIEQPQLKEQIEQLFLEQPEVNFYIMGACQNELFLSVKVKLVLEGTFVR